MRGARNRKWYRAHASSSSNDIQVKSVQSVNSTWTLIGEQALHLSPHSYIIWSSHDFCYGVLLIREFSCNKPKQKQAQRWGCHFETKFGKLLQKVQPKAMILQRLLHRGKSNKLLYLPFMLSLTFIDFSQLSKLWSLNTAALFKFNLLEGYLKLALFSNISCLSKESLQALWEKKELVLLGQFASL